MLFYNASSGAAATFRVDKNGVASSWLASFTLAAGITHLAAVGSDRLFLYRSSTGTGYTARLAATGAYTAGQTINGFNTNFVHVVGTRAGGLFLLTSSGVAATATINANLVYTYTGSVGGFASWSHVTSVNDRGLFFYNSANGIAYSSEITSAGLYQSFTQVNGLQSGQLYVVGASNGTVLFVNGSGVGSTGKIDPTTGSYTVKTSGISGFSTNWTNASAE